MALEALSRELVAQIATDYPRLQSLNLSHNVIREVAYLELLPHLQKIDLSFNRLVSLPPHWGATQLELLNLHGNQMYRLAAVPERMRVSADARCGREPTGANQRTAASAVALGAENARAAGWDGNPMASQPTYRREVISMLPQLETLDHRDITAAERLYSKLQHKMPLSIAPSLPITSALPVANDHSMTPSRRTPSLSLASSSSSLSSALSLRPDDVHTEPSAVQTPSLLTPENVQERWRPHMDSRPSVSMSLPAREPSLKAADVMDRSHCRRVPSESTSLNLSPTAGRRHQRITTTDMAVQAVEPLVPSSGSQEIRLLQSRIAALERILSIQDQTIQSGLVQLGQAKRITVVSDGKTDPDAIGQAATAYMQLLAMWREKVIKLMVQMQSMELTKSDHTRALAIKSADIEAKRMALEQQCELWKQKWIDIEAQRDLERVRSQQSHQQITAANAKVVHAVRTLASEREKLHQMASVVATFCARDGDVGNQVKNLHDATQRVAAFEQRLTQAKERLDIARSLVAHREARLRNSEAALIAERRIWSHRLAKATHEQMQSSLLAQSKGLNESSISVSSASKGASQTRLKPGPNGKILRPATETAFRTLFHRLDAYGTGLVRAQALLAAIRTDNDLMAAVGSVNKRDKLATHVETALRKRSRAGAVSGSITWGELLLFFMPASSMYSDLFESERVDAGGNENDQCCICTGGQQCVPPPFSKSFNTGGNFDRSDKQDKGNTRKDRKAFTVLSRDELVDEILALREDRSQLRIRVLSDARELQKRASRIQNEWKHKVEELIANNEEFQRTLKALEASKKTIELERDQAERNHSEVQHQLQALRRQLLQRESEFKSVKEDLEQQRVQGVQREQDIWQKEMSDMNFRYSCLQAENTKLDLTIRQLERELVKQKDHWNVVESRLVQQLEDKVRKRDGDLAKLRRERNSILNTLREQERKVAQAPKIVTENAATQTVAESLPPAPKVHSIACQVEDDMLTRKRTSDMRMSLEEIAIPDAPIAPSKHNNAPSHQREVREKRVTIDQDVTARLEQLQSLTESLLAD